MPEPNTSHPAWGDKQAFLLEFIAHAQLPVSRLINGHCHYSLLDLCIYPVGRQWLSAAHLFKGRFSAGFVELLKAVETVSAVAQRLSHEIAILQACETLPNCLASSSTPSFGLMIFSCVLMT